VHQQACIGSGVQFVKLTTPGKLNIFGKLNILVNITFFPPQLFKIGKTIALTLIIIIIIIPYGTEQKMLNLIS